MLFHDFSGWSKGSWGLSRGAFSHDDNERLLMVMNMKASTAVDKQQKPPSLSPLEISLEEFNARSMNLVLAQAALPVCTHRVVVISNMIALPK
jgi:hypothetical protein